MGAIGTENTFRKHTKEFVLALLAAKKAAEKEGRNIIHSSIEKPLIDVAEMLGIALPDTMRSTAEIDKELIDYEEIAVSINFILKALGDQAAILDNSVDLRIHLLQELENRNRWIKLPSFRRWVSRLEKDQLIDMRGKARPWIKEWTKEWIDRMNTSLVKMERSLEWKLNSQPRRLQELKELLQNYQSDVLEKGSYDEIAERYYLDLRKQLEEFLNMYEASNPRLSPMLVKKITLFITVPRLEKVRLVVEAIDKFHATSVIKKVGIIRPVV
jgi:hypothetical protein